MQVAQHSHLDWSQTPRPQFRSWTASALIIGLGAPVLGHLLLRLSSSIFAENGYVETSQAGLLVVAAILFLLAYCRSAGAKAAFCALMAALAAIAVQREIPACQSAFYESGLCLARSTKGAVSALAVLAGVGLVFAKGVAWRSFSDLRNTAWVWPVAVAATLLGLAEVAEHWVHQETEETLEFGAYAYLAVYAFWVGSRPLPEGPVDRAD